ncbi:MAG: phosphoribosylamine--glycine ligase [Flavobacterium sp.]
MNILLLGSGGREHAFAWKMTQSSKLTQLFVAPGNAGTANIATHLSLNILDFEAIKNAVVENNIQMVVVGPEDPLVAGIYDYFKADDVLKNIPVIGPSKMGAALEGSKDFAKQFLIKNKIPTAAYATFTAENLQEGFAFLETLTPPYVLKADGLAAGKGVLILDDLEVAKQELSEMLMHQKFGNASAKVVIEEFLDGIELSCFVLTDGNSYKILPTAKDYKRIGEGDQGLNTGGMGAISPVPFADEAFMKLIENQIVIPTIEGLKADSIDYIGFIFIGLIKVKDQPYVIEYNVRMGDPETEVVLPRIENDLVSLFEAVANGNLAAVDLQVNPQTAATIMMVSGGYPEDYEKGKIVSGLESVSGSIVFHAGTKMTENNVVTNGGRVLAITSFGNDIKEATKKSYQNINLISFDKMYFRKDIGLDLF